MLLRFEFLFLEGNCSNLGLSRLLLWLQLVRLISLNIVMVNQFLFIVLQEKLNSS